MALRLTCTPFPRGDADGRASHAGTAHSTGLREVCLDTAPWPSSPGRHASGLLPHRTRTLPGPDGARAHQGQTPSLAAFMFFLRGQLQTGDVHEPLRPLPAGPCAVSEAGRLHRQGQGPRTPHAEGHQLPPVVALPQNQPCASHRESVKLNSEENEASPRNKGG